MQHFACALDESLKKWIRNTARENYWRVMRWYEIDDLISDGYLVAANIMARYHPVNQRHFMALVMIAYTNHITSLSRKRSRGDDLLISHEAPEGADIDDWMSALTGYAHNVGTITRLISQARYPVSIAIELFTTERGVAEVRRRPQRAHESLNHYICRLIGLDPRDYDLPELIQSFIRGDGLYFLHQPV